MRHQGKLRNGWSRSGHSAKGMLYGILILFGIIGLILALLSGLLYWLLGRWKAEWPKSLLCGTAAVVPLGIFISLFCLHAYGRSWLRQAKVFWNSPVTWAVTRAHPRALRAILALGGDAKGPPWGQEKETRYLHLASSRHHREAVIPVLIAAGADVNGLDGEELTAMDRAAKIGNVRAAKALLAGGANVNKSSPLFFAAGKSPSMTRWLLDNGALFDKEIKGDGWRKAPIWNALQDKRADIVRILVDNGAPINFAGEEGTTPLHVAAAKLSRLVPYLLSKGADVNARDEAGRTPLDVAMENPASVREALLKNGARSGGAE